MLINIFRGTKRAYCISGRMKLNFCAQWKKECIIQSMKYSWTTIYTNTSMLDIDKKILCLGLHRVCRSVEKTSPNYENK